MKRQKYLKVVFCLLSVVFFACLLTDLPTTAIAKQDELHSLKVSKKEGINVISQGEKKTLSEAERETMKDKLAENYGRFPLFFIENRGQVDGQVRFYEKGQEHATYFTHEGVVFTLFAPRSDTSPQEGKGASSQTSQEKAGQDRPQEKRMSSVVSLFPVGLNPEVKIVAEDLQEGTANYFIGKDPSKWHTKVPTYRSVVYREAYPGVDLKFYGNNRQLEYDIIVKSGADPSQVKFRYEGVEDLRVNEQGDLSMRLKEGGELVQKKPVVYQMIDGNRVARESVFRLYKDSLAHGTTSGVNGEKPFLTGVKSENIYGFDVAFYDKNYPVVIDPTLLYSTFLGGTGDDYGSSIAVDESGNAYITGSTNSLDFPLQNAIDPQHGGKNDVFVTKINATGTALLYSTFLGGSDNDYGSNIAVDGSGNTYITGSTNSLDFPIQNALYPQKAGDTDAFVARINASGTALVYSTYLGGGKSDTGSGIAVDGSGNAYITGHTNSLDFPTENAVYPQKAGDDDVFVAKIDPSGTDIFYSTYLGGSGYDSAKSIAVDTQGNAYITGRTESPDFPTVNPLYPSFGEGICDAFVTKINASGSILYSTYLGGSGPDMGQSIAVDESGNAYIAGWTNSSDFPMQNAIYPNFGGGESDAFVTKINSDGTSLLYSTFLGGSNVDKGLGIAVDRSRNTFVTGLTLSTDFPTQNPLYPEGRNYDGFVAKINPTGTSLVYSTFLGGTGVDYAYSIAVDRSGIAYITGQTSSPDFPTQNAPYQNLGGFVDAFVVKLSDVLLPDLKVMDVWSPNNAARGKSITVSCTVKNQGDAASGGFSVSYYLSKDNSIDPGSAYLIGSQSIASLAPHKSSNTKSTISIQKQIPAGAYYLGVIVDPSNNIIEKDESNNMMVSRTIIYVNDINDGLIAYYPFNGNANDESGNGNHGTVYGSALTKDRFGKPNRAYSFDGVDDYIDVGNDPSFNITSITISAWVKFNTDPYNLIQSRSYIVAKFNSWMLWYSADGEGDSDPDQMFLDLWDWQGINTKNTKWHSNQWYHIVETYDGANVKVYINGILNNTTPLSKTLHISDYNVHIGAWSNGTSFNGKIDDIRIYNRSISNAEVKQLYTLR